MMKTLERKRTPIMHLGSALMTSRSGGRSPEHVEYPTQRSNHQNRTNFHRAPLQAPWILVARSRWVLHSTVCRRHCMEWHMEWHDDRGQGCPETLRKTPHCPLAGPPVATRSNQKRGAAHDDTHRYVPPNAGALCHCDAGFQLIF